MSFRLGIGWASMLIAGSAAAQTSAPPSNPANDAIVVTGTRYAAPGVFLNNLGPTSFHVDIHGFDVFENGDAPQTSQHQCTRQAAMREAGADTAAKNISAKIASFADSDKYEYGALIIQRANGSIDEGPISKGTSWADGAATGSPPTVNYIVPKLYFGDYIIGAIHNHPIIGDPNPDINLMPSTQDMTVQYQLNLTFLGQHVAPTTAFDYYVIGGDKVDREYKADAGQPTKPSSGTKGDC